MKERERGEGKRCWIWGWGQPLIEGKVGRLVEFTYPELLSKYLTMYSVYAGATLWNPTPRRKGGRPSERCAMCIIILGDDPPPGFSPFEDLRRDLYCTTETRYISLFLYRFLEVRLLSAGEQIGQAKRSENGTTRNETENNRPFDLAFFGAPLPLFFRSSTSCNLCCSTVSTSPISGNWRMMEESEKGGG